MEDITDREREAEKSRLLASEQAARAEAEQANRNKDEFLAMLAHELRNPLAPILNSLLILRSPDIATADIDWAVAIMERQVRHMSRLIEDLLDVSRITRGKIELRKRTRRAGVDRGARRRDRPPLDRGAEPPAHRRRSRRSRYGFDADPARLEQVVANLLNNAAKYTDDGGQIALDAEAVDDEVVLRVRDTGIRDRAGVAAQRSSTCSCRPTSRSTGPQGGLGIGLTLVRTLVEMHGGTVEVRSEGIGRGSEFTVRLPRHLQADRPARSSAGQPLTTLIARRVLVVDDNVGCGNHARQAAGPLGTRSSTIAHDGPDGPGPGPRIEPRISFCWISACPGMDGYEVARRIRRADDSTLPVLVALTGYGQRPIAEDPGGRLRSSPRQAGGSRCLAGRDRRAVRSMLGRSPPEQRWTHPSSRDLGNRRASSPQPEFAVADQFLSWSWSSRLSTGLQR